MKKLLIIIPLLLILTGCYNYRELNELAIATGFGIDKEGDNYVVTVMISNSKKQDSNSNNTQAAMAVYEGSGDTIYTAIKNASLSISKQIYLGHIDILVLSESVVKEDVSKALDLFFRYPQTRNDYNLVIAKDCKAGDVLKISLPLDSFPSQNIANNLEITSKLQGYIYEVDFNTFMKTLLDDGINPVLPSITIIGDVEEGNKEDNLEQNAPKTYLKLEMMGLFKDRNFVAWASKKESQGINIINNKIKVLGVEVNLDNQKIIAEITSSKTKVEIDSDNPQKVKINVAAEGGIQEFDSSLNLTDNNLIVEIQKQVENNLKEYIQAALSLAQKNKTDIFGFGQMFYKKNPQHWKEIKDKWDDELFSNIEVEMNVEVDLKVKGHINNTIEVKS